MEYFDISRIGTCRLDGMEHPENWENGKTHHNSYRDEMEPTDILVVDIQYKYFFAALILCIPIAIVDCV